MRFHLPIPAAVCRWCGVALFATAAASGFSATSANAEGPARLLKAVQTVAREGAVAAPLPNGEVLIAGGQGSNPSAPYLESAELYVPATETFVSLGATMKSRRGYAVAAPLPGGKVLITGGNTGSGYLNTAELYNPTSKGFEAISATEINAREDAVAIALANGNVLIVGGYSSSGELPTAEIYNAEKERFETAASRPVVTRGSYPAVVRYAPGKVLIAGGDNSSYLASAELYNEDTQRFEALPQNPTLVTAAYGAAGLSFSGGGTYLAGGYDGAYLATVEEFFPSDHTFLTVAWHLAEPRWDPVVAPIGPTQELIAGGEGPTNGEAPLATAEVITRPATQAKVAGGYFGSVPVGQTSPAQAVTISNIGEGALVISTVKVLGTGASQFKVYEDNCSGLEVVVRGSCTVFLYFAPTSAGESQATLNVEGAESPKASATLRGSGFVALGPPGPAGERGPTGPTGQRGPAGPAGKEGRPQSRRCLSVKKRVRRHGRVVVKHLRRCSAGKSHSKRHTRRSRLVHHRVARQRRG